MSPQFDPQSEEFFSGDPYETYRWLRDEAPLYHNETAKFWAVSRYDDVMRGFADWANLTSTRGVSIEINPDQITAGSLLVNDPPGEWREGTSPSRSLSLNPPTGLWDRRLGPGGRWAGACVRAGAFWGVQDWGAGLVRVGGAWGSAALRGALSGGSDELGQVADVSQGGGEGVCPWPVERQAQSVAAAVVDEAARCGEEPVADGGRDGELLCGVGFAEAGGPAGEVVREDAAGEPGGVGGEPSRGAAAEPGAFFEVSDGELDCGVVSVVGVGCFG